MKMQLIIFFFFFSCILLRSISTAHDRCRPASCSPIEPVIRFPLRIIGRQPSSCGFPGFDLSCNEENQTIIQLPSSSSYIVKRIDYLSQVVYLYPDFCPPKEIKSFNVSDTPFNYSNLRSYTFYNCSQFGPSYGDPYLCINNYSVLYVRNGIYPPRNLDPILCKVIKTIQVPIRWNGDIQKELGLLWLTPSCSRCEMEGRGCEMVNEDGQTRCIDSSHGFPTSAKYGLSLGIGVPLSIGLIGLIYYAATRKRHNAHQQSVDLSSNMVIQQPTSRTGLDEPTIESYPKSTFGESCISSNNDRTCVICLLEYKPKESLRTIPECKHYFHVECIDEWLKVNGTCPLCRKSP